MRMKKSVVALVSGVMLTICSGSMFASSLWEVYEQATKSDPQFQSALAEQMSVAEKFPQARAVMLPQLTSPNSLIYTRTDYEMGTSATSGTYAGQRQYTVKQRTSNIGLNLTQSIFNFTNWANLLQARDTVKAASAKYNASIQDLMERTCSAYLAVLQAKDVLRFTIAEMQAYHQEYERALQSFHVGVTTITDVYNAKAYYDTSSASYITALHDVENKQEDLRAITGVFYSRLNPLKEIIPLIVPAPVDMEQWAKTAVRQNWTVTAARFTTLAAHKAVYSARGGHVPTVSATATYNNQLVRTYDGGGWTRQKGPSARMDLSIPLYQGGLVNSQVRQAIANYEKAMHDQETALRKVVDDTRKAYLGILSGIQRVKADKQVIISNKSSLEGMQAGYRVGTRTIVDVLNAQKQLYNSEKENAIARYDYIKSIISLKRNAGTLSDADIQAINNWLSLQEVAISGKEQGDNYNKELNDDQIKSVASQTKTSKPQGHVKKTTKALSRKPTSRSSAKKIVARHNLSLSS